MKASLRQIYGIEEDEMKLLRLMKLHGGEEFLHIGEIHSMPEIPSLFNDYSEKINYSSKLAECLRSLQLKVCLDFTPILTKERKEYQTLGKISAPAYRIKRLALAILSDNNG